MRVLLTESASLTARETLSVLGPSGAEIHAMTTGGVPLVRFSRWCRALHRAPSSAADPDGYLAALAATTARERIDVVLATHEQGWLAATHRDSLPGGFPLALAPADAFARVQGKAAFARTCDELGLPQPVWAPVRKEADAGAVGFPCWVKAERSTAGRGVRHAADMSEAVAACRDLGGPAAGLMVQAPAPGRYAQAAGLFDRGRLIALHCSELIGTGVGGSAAARLSVAHPMAARGLIRLGRELRWTGGLTIDYLHVGGLPQFIECNPRTVEPGNAARAGVDFPGLTIALTLDRPLPERPILARPGVRTRSTMALLLGAAEQTGRRGAIVRAAVDALARRGPLRHSHEVLTPALHDPPSIVPVLIAGFGVMAWPPLAAKLAAGAVASYASASAIGGKVSPSPPA